MRLGRYPLVILLSACSSGADSSDSNTDAAHPTLAPVDAQAAANVVEDLQRVEPDLRYLLAARALAELERGRVPQSLLDGVDGIATASPDQRSTVLARALGDNLGLLDHMCANQGEAMMKRLAELTNQQRAEIVFDTCKLESKGYVTREELERVDALSLLFGHLVDAHLHRAGAELHPGERAAIAALARAGIDRSE